MEWLLVGAGVLLLVVVVRFIRALGDVHACARTGRTERLAQLLARDPALLTKANADGEQPVHQAAKYGQVEALTFLLGLDSKIDATTPQGVTPLHLAAAFGEAETVTLLLDRGAKVDPKEETGMTPLMAAQAGNHEEIITILKAAGADDTARPAVGDMGGGHFVSSVSDSDPLMLKTVEKARSTLATLRSLFREHPLGTMVKIPFTTDSGQTEHLWADLLELGADRMTLRIRTDPVAHTGTFDRVQVRPLTDLEDWQVEQRDGSIRGGFGYQVLFLRTREQLGTLPEVLALHESRFVDHDPEACR